MRGLDRMLDILRVMVGAADDEDVLDPPGDEHFSVRVEKPEIAGAKPDRFGFAGDRRAKTLLRRRPVGPVALRDIGPSDPDLTDLVGPKPPSCIGIDDRDPLIDERPSASDRELGVLIAFRRGEAIMLWSPARSARRVTVAVPARPPAAISTVASAMP